MSIDFSDQDLVSRVRHGDTAAFGDLYAHHSAAAHRAARRIVRDPHVAEDVVSEAFARVFKALQGGQGPTGDLFPYLLVTMRNVAASWGRESVKWTPVGDDTAFQPRDARDVVAGSDELPVDRLNMSLTSSAFETLPRRWRTVLWYLEVEGESATEVGQRLGLSDVAVRQLARRAREGLREAYLAAYLGTGPTVGQHVPSADLVSMARGKLSLRRRASVEKHLDTCAKCSGMLFEAAEENSTLRALALPFYVAIAYAAVRWTQGIRNVFAHLPGKHLYRTPAVQAGLVVVGITAVVTGALAATPNFKHKNDNQAGGGAAVVRTTSPSASPNGPAPPPTSSSSSSAVPTPATTAPTTSVPPAPTIGPTAQPTQLVPTPLPTVLFPTTTTVPLTTTPPVPSTSATQAAPSSAAPTTTPTTTTTAPTTTPSTAPPTTTASATTTTPTTTPTTTTPTTTATTTAPPPPSGISVSNTQLSPGPNGNTSFTFTVTNNTDETTDQTVTMTIPDGVELAAQYSNCTQSGQSLTCQPLGQPPNTKLAPGASSDHTLLLRLASGPGAVTQEPTDIVAAPFAG